jgi:hypothetical protein
MVLRFLASTQYLLVVVMECQSGTWNFVALRINSWLLKAHFSRKKLKAIGTPVALLATSVSSRQEISLPLPLSPDKEGLNLNE